MVADAAYLLFAVNRRLAVGNRQYGVSSFYLHFILTKDGEVEKDRAPVAPGVGTVGGVDECRLLAADIGGGVFRAAYARGAPLPPVPPEAEGGRQHVRGTPPLLHGKRF